MKKPVVDYRQFRFSKIRDPQFNHLLYLTGWLVYFTLYYLTERFIPNGAGYKVECALDHIIPFCEYFIVPYVLWYALIAGSLIYFALYNPKNFKNMQTFLILVQMMAMVIYIVFPNYQDLRPETFENENLFTYITGLIYQVDTNSNVCPSMHVAFSIGMASTWIREKSAAKWVRVCIVLFCATVCISVAFVKQHSVLDIFAAIPLCLFAEWFTFWRKKRNVKG